MLRYIVLPPGSAAEAPAVDPPPTAKEVAVSLQGSSEGGEKAADPSAAAAPAADKAPAADQSADKEAAASGGGFELPPAVDEAAAPRTQQKARMKAKDYQ